MKRKNNLGLFSGIAIGLASIYALSAYFGLTWTELKSFMLSTLLLLAAMLVLAVVLVAIIKLLGKVLARLRGDSQATDDDHE
jgi:hypothetical protein